jgi:uncharacterized protein (TIGR00369 family)
MDAASADTQQAIDLFNQVNQYARHNGMALDVEAPGRVAYRMEVAAQHLSSPGTAHGGALAGLMDATLGAAALTLAFPRGQLVSTVEFKINYLRPAREGDRLVARGEVEHAGGRIITASGWIYRAAGDIDSAGDSAADGAADNSGDGETGEVVARALGTFNAYPLSKGNFAGALDAPPETSDS